MSQPSRIIELPDIIQSLQNKQWTGTLELAGGEQTSSFLFFRQGLIRHSKVRQRRQVVLGQALYELGLIDEADYVMTLVDYEQTGRRFGEVLVELGLVDPEAIKQALVFQAREDILDTLTWSDLDARFHAGDPPLPEVFGERDTEVDLAISGMSVLMEAARRSDEWSLVREHIPSEEDVPVPAQGGAVPPELLDRRVRLLIDGYRSAYGVAEDAPINKIECLKTLAELVRDGHLRLLEPAELAQIGVVAEGDEDYEKAVRVYELAASRGLEHLDLFRRAARACQRAGHLEEARERWLSVADRCAAVDRRDVALEALREAIELDASDRPLRKRLAELLLESGAEAEATGHLRTLAEQTLAAEAPLEEQVEALSRFLDQAPDDKELLRTLAERYLELDDKVQAMARYDELASLHVDGGDLEEAVSLYYTILDIDAENLQARLALSQTLGNMGSTDDAVREYRRLADILYNSGLISNSINWPFLIRVYESIVELEPSSTPAWEWLAKAYIENGQQDLAVSRLLGMAESLEPPEGAPPPVELLTPLERVVELAPDRLDVRRRLARALFALGRVERGTAALRDLAERALYSGQVDEAHSAYQEALETAPFDTDSRRGLAAIHETHRRYPEAQALWRDVGILCRRAGLLDAAARDFVRALKLDRTDAESLHEFAATEEARGEPRNAAALYARFAETALARSDYGRARDALRRALQLDPQQAKAAEVKAKLDAIPVG